MFTFESLKFSNFKMLLLYLFKRIVIMDLKEILDFIKKTRTSKGLTQKDMANKLGLKTNMTYQKYENNEIKLTVENLFKILRILETPFPSSVDGEEYTALKKENIELKERIQEQKEYLDMLRELNKIHTDRHGKIDIFQRKIDSWDKVISALADTADHKEMIKSMLDSDPKFKDLWINGDVDGKLGWVYSGGIEWFEENNLSHLLPKDL